MMYIARPLSAVGGLLQGQGSGKNTGNNQPERRGRKDDYEYQSGGKPGGRKAPRIID